MKQSHLLKPNSVQGSPECLSECPSSCPTHLFISFAFRLNVALCSDKRVYRGHKEKTATLFPNRREAGHSRKKQRAEVWVSMVASWSK